LLVEHPDVIEAAVIGVPDRLRGEVIEAFVVLRLGPDGSHQLAGELQQLVKKSVCRARLSAAGYVVDQRARTPSGK
jgi:acetyl-CoA synthetase